MPAQFAGVDLSGKVNRHLLGLSYGELTELYVPPESPVTVWGGVPSALHSEHTVLAWLVADIYVPEPHALQVAAAVLLFAMTYPAFARTLYVVADHLEPSHGSRLWVTEAHPVIDLFGAL